MKKIYFFFLLFLSVGVKAQWVSIPDTNFGKWLDGYGPYTCMQGNSTIGWQMDTTCPDVLNTTRAVCRGSFGPIRDLTGIEYFDNLDTLDCSYNELTSLPALPGGLTTLLCVQNQLTSLPALPASLTYLDCHNNQLTSLPPLGNLDTLRCSNNQLTSLPTLPGNLIELDCGDNQITSLPFLPGSLANLQCAVNLLTSLPVLPGSLIWLFCYNNQLTSLPTLPAGLLMLDCDENQLTSLPALPAGFYYLLCNHNQISSLPSLPDSLKILDCSFNQLTSLPALPGKLWELSCTSNQLTSLPALPATVSWLYCDTNQLTSIPELPDSLDQFYCNNNPQLRCMPPLKKIAAFYFANTAITCLPNYPLSNSWSEPSLDSVPICDLFNPNNCQIYWNLGGNTYEDVNLNCVNDSSDREVNNLKMQLWNGGNLVEEVITLVNGSYSFVTDSFDNYQIRVDTAGLPFDVTCPSNNLLYDTLTAVDSVHFDRNFALKCNTGFDLAAWSIEGRFRPGGTRQVNIHVGSASYFYGINCLSGAGVTGSVTVAINGPASYISPAPGALTADNVSSNVLTYYISDFGTVDFNNSFNIIVQTNITAAIGNTICFTVNVSPITGDDIPTNNIQTHCFVVVASIDPNNKEVYPLDTVDISGDRWLTYTINFQNTGTDTAQHIYVTDTLDVDLDESSLQLLAYSHQPLVQIKGKEVRFNFPNINLPDSNVNEPASHGYVQYKIKLKDNLPIGTSINNTAFIYFDFNAPVVTNTTSNTITTTITKSDYHPESLDFNIFPNPSENTLGVTIDENYIGSALNIYDMTGKKVETLYLTSHSFQINIELLSKGVYIAELKTKNLSRKMKLIKM